MDKEEAQDMIDSLYPVGQERWIKVKYLDQKKAMKVIRMRNADTSKLGFEVIAISISSEHEPQLSALIDLKSSVIAELLKIFQPDDQRIANFNQIFLNKIEELRKQTIKYDDPNNEIDSGVLVLDRTDDNN